MLFMPCKHVAKDEDFTYNTPKFCFSLLNFYAEMFESRPKLALAHDGNCLTSAIQGTPNSSCLLLHLWCKCLFLLSNARLNLIRAYHSQAARQPQRLLSPPDQWRSFHGRNRKIPQCLLSSEGDTKKG